MNPISWRWAYVDWAATVTKYGYKTQSELTKQSKVLVICTDCKLPTLETSLACMRIRTDQKRKGQTTYIPICKSCQQKRVWATNEEFRRNQSIVQAEAMRKVWTRPEYRENASI